MPEQSPHPSEVPPSFTQIHAIRSMLENPYALIEYLEDLEDPEDQLPEAA